MPPASPGLPPRIAVLAKLLALRAVRVAPFDLSLMDDLDTLDDLPAGCF